MADFHKVVINNVSKVISWKAVRLKQNRVRRNIFVLPYDVAKKVVRKFCFSFHWNLKTDYVWLTCVEISLYFFRSKVTAVAVVTRSHLIFCLNLANTVKAFCITEAVVSLSLFYEFISVFLIKFKTLTLNIRTVFAALRTAFIPVDSKPCHCIIKILNIFFVVTGTVCIFETQNKFSVLRTCKKIIKKRSANTTNVLHSSWGRRITYTNFFVCHK